MIQVVQHLEVVKGQAKYTLQEIHIALGQVVRLLLEVQVQIQKNCQLLYMGRILHSHQVDYITVEEEHLCKIVQI